jgi:hypothetical protein
MQVSGALGLALPGIVATNHTEGLHGAYHGRTGSPIGGYHLAFLARAAAIAAGMVLALALLRPRAERRAPELAEVPPKASPSASWQAPGLSGGRHDTG